MKRFGVLTTIGAVLLLGSLGIGIPVLLSGDHDEYGRVSVPGEGTVELPTGEVVVFYEEARSVGEDSLDVPGLDWQVRPPGGDPLAFDGDGGLEVASREDYSFTDIERLDIDEEGHYGVIARATSETGPGPTLTFGTSGVTTGRVAIVCAGIVLGVFMLFLGVARPLLSRS